MIATCFNCLVPEDLYRYFFARPEKAEITGRLNQGKREFLMRETEQPYPSGDEHREVRYGEICDILLVEKGYYPSIRPIRWGGEIKWESGWYDTSDSSGVSSGELYDSPKDALYFSILDIIKELERNGTGY